MRTGGALTLAIVVFCSAPAPARADDGAPGPTPASTPAPVAAAPAAPEPHKNWLAPPKPIWPIIAMVVVAGAGVAVSAVYALKSGSDQSSYDSASFEITTKTGTFGFPDGTGACARPSSPDVATACNKLKSSQDAVNTDNTLLVVGGVVAGTAVVAGVVYYFFGAGKGDAQVARQPPVVTPWLGAGAGGLSVVGRF